MDRKFHSAYSTPKQRVRIIFPDKDRTKQQFKSESDVNNIVAKFRKTGLIDFVNRRSAQYADVSGLQFQSAMDLVARANTLFHELPANIRDRFQNSPAQFFDFVNNPANREEAEALGVVKPKEDVGAGAPTDAVGESGGAQARGVATPLPKSPKSAKNPPSSEAKGGESQGGAE